MTIEVNFKVLKYFTLFAYYFCISYSKQNNFTPTIFKIKLDIVYLLKKNNITLYYR